MRNFLYCLFIISLFTNCEKSNNKNSTQNIRMELIPEPDQDERLQYEAMLKLKKSNCILDEPDTSINGINIRDYESAKKLIEEKDKKDDLGQYHLYSNSDIETLTLVQHPGDSKYEISIFKVEDSGRLFQDYRHVKAAAFITNNGIKLGMNKSDIIKKLGKCYTAKDSMKGFIELYYRIELPNDTKSKLLKNNNMPTYYASYKLRKNRLEKFEFGFEYP